jgi:hypothetical protein
MNPETSQNDQNPPYSNLPNFASQPSGLGSLAQSSRKKTLKQTKGILIVIGILTLLANVFMFLNSEKEVDDLAKTEIAKVQQQPGMVVDPAGVAEFKSKVLTIVRIIYGSLIALGALYIIFGLIIYTYPVPISIASLVLYLGANACLGYLDPMFIAQGALWKIVIVVALIKGIQAAIAYQSEQNSMQYQEAYPTA